METIRLKSHIGNDGLLRFELPTAMRNVEADIVIVYSVNDEPEEDPAEWDAFIDATYGILADDPIERPATLPKDVRDELL